jgi:ComF family protein
MHPLLERLLDGLSPRRCLGCRAASAQPFCTGCGEPRAAPSTPSFDGAPLIVLGRYEGALAQAIRRLKYEPRPELATPLSALLAARVRECSLPMGLGWVPVPLHFERLVERGFNQSALVANGLASALKGQAYPRALRRERATAQQAKLARSERLENLHGAFSVRALPERRLVLVDDVVTTGATASACVAALRAAGAAVLAVAALAHADDG